jgi:hypothetical protein
LKVMRKYGSKNARSLKSPNKQIDISSIESLNIPSQLSIIQIHRFPLGVYAYKKMGSQDYLDVEESLAGLYLHKRSKIAELSVTLR